jgi:hypothetical protein
MSSPRKIELTLKDPPMTVIAALQESPDSILIAADSQTMELQVTGQVRHSSNHKLQVHPKLPIAWGVYDNIGIGAEFNEWLKQYHWAPLVEWYDVQQQIAEHLATLNGSQRRLCTIAGRLVQDSELCGALIVAFYGGIGRVFQVSASGMVSAKQEHEFHAVGSGFIHANIAYKTIMRVGPNISAENKLRTAVQIAAEDAPTCGPPVHVARVTSNGVEMLSNS